MPAATKEKNSKNEAIDTKKFDTEKIEKIYTYIFFGKNKLPMLHVVIRGDDFSLAVECFITCENPRNEIIEYVSSSHFLRFS